MGGWDLNCTGVVPKMLCANITYFHTLYIKTSHDRSMLSVLFQAYLNTCTEKIPVMAFFKLWINKFVL
jgi:hypothetical protein